MKERESLEDCLAKAWRSGRCRLGRVVDAGARAVSLDAATGLHAVAPCAALAGGRCLIRPFAVDSADADGEAADAFCRAGRGGREPPCHLSLIF